MDEYVRRADLLAEYDRQHIGPPGGARKIMETMPAAKVREDIPAEWITRGGKPHCSKCDATGLLKLESNVGGCREYAYQESPFCHNCGARMTK